MKLVPFKELRAEYEVEPGHEYCLVKAGNIIEYDWSSLTDYKARVTLVEEELLAGIDPSGKTTRYITVYLEPVA